MNFVFFDIECACVLKNVAKICAFGYVVTDESFNILEKEDILINPQGHFHLTNNKGGKGIVLPYEYEEFKNYPTFPQVYPKILSLLEGKNKIIVGHSTMNDVKYLTLETQRFSLPSFQFEFTDTQIIYMTKLNSFSRQLGLEGIIQDLGVEFTPHRAADDAYATMKVAQSLCLQDNVSFKDLLKKYKIKKGKIENYQMTNGTSQAFSQYQKEQAKKKEEREKIRTEFFNYVDKTEKAFSFKRKNNPQKIFCFSRDIEDDLSRSKKYVSCIYAQGNKYSLKTEPCTIYVYGEEQPSSLRLKNVEKAQKIIWTEKELIEFLKCNTREKN